MHEQDPAIVLSKLKLINRNHFTAIWLNPPSGNIQTQEKDTKFVVVRLIAFESL